MSAAFRVAAARSASAGIAHRIDRRAIAALKTTDTQAARDVTQHRWTAERRVGRGALAAGAARLAGRRARVAGAAAVVDAADAGVARGIAGGRERVLAIRALKTGDTIAAAGIAERRRTAAESGAGSGALSTSA